MMKYYIYHDKVTLAATVHYGKCRSCKDGQGMHGHQVKSQNEWYGGNSIAEIYRIAKEKGCYDYLKDCRMSGCVVCYKSPETKSTPAPHNAPGAIRGRFVALLLPS
jgi:hypothetical protein